MNDFLSKILGDEEGSNFVLEHKISLDWQSVIRTAIVALLVSGIINLWKNKK